MTLVLHTFRALWLLPFIQKFARFQKISEIISEIFSRDTKLSEILRSERAASQLKCIQSRQMYVNQEYIHVCTLCFHLPWKRFPLISPSATFPTNANCPKKNAGVFIATKQWQYKNKFARNSRMFVCYRSISIFSLAKWATTESRKLSGEGQKKISATEPACDRKNRFPSSNNHFGGTNGQQQEAQREENRRAPFSHFSHICDKAHKQIAKGWFLRNLLSSLALFLKRS